MQCHAMQCHAMQCHGAAFLLLCSVIVLLCSAMLCSARVLACNTEVQVCSPVYDDWYAIVCCRFWEACKRLKYAPLKDVEKIVQEIYT